jgi:L-ascorbate metabolism protein UlaG (beta-lactamase superfamily)
MDSLRITLIGGPTALIEIDGFRLLTDPTLRREAINCLMSSSKS